MEIFLLFQIIFIHLILQTNGRPTTNLWSMHDLVEKARNTRRTTHEMNSQNINKFRFLMAISLQNFRQNLILDEQKKTSEEKQRQLSKYLKWKVTETSVLSDFFPRYF